MKQHTDLRTPCCEAIFVFRYGKRKCEKCAKDMTIEYVNLLEDTIDAQWEEFMGDDL